MKNYLLIVWILVLLPWSLSAQSEAINPDSQGLSVTYPGFFIFNPGIGERTIAEFEEQSLFFRPSGISSTGIGIFGEVDPGTSNHLLSKIQQNPARLHDAMTGRVYFYADVRSQPVEVLSRDYPYTSPGMSANDLSFLTVFTQPRAERKVQEPLVSAALFFQPSEEGRLVVGATWQYLRLHQNFYEMPGMVMPLSPRFGNQSAAEKVFDAGELSDQLPEAHNFSLPSLEHTLTDRDYLDQTAHFPSFLMSWNLSSRVTLAVATGVGLFDGHGYRQLGQLFHSQFEEHLESSRNYRIQSYSHWDVSAGAEIRWSDRIQTGLTIGFLKGSAEQSSERVWIRNSNSGQLSHDNDHSLKRNLTLNEQAWGRDGRTLNGALDVRFHLSDNRNLRFLFRSMKVTQEMNFDGIYLDNYLEVSEVVHQQETNSEFTLLSETATGRAGLGDLTDWNHSFHVGIDHRISSNFRLYSSIQVDFFNRTAESKELNIQSIRNMNEQRVGDEEPSAHFTNSETHNEVMFETSSRAINLYLPLKMSWAVFRAWSLEATLLPSFHDIDRDDSFRATQTYLEFESPGGVTINSEPQSLGLTHDDDRFNHFRFNTLISVQYQPLDSITFRLTGMPDYRNHDPVIRSDVDAFRYRFSIEVQL